MYSGLRDNQREMWTGTVPASKPMTRGVWRASQIAGPMSIACVTGPEVWPGWVRAAGPEPCLGRESSFYWLTVLVALLDVYGATQQVEPMSGSDPAPNTCSLRRQAGIIHRYRTLNTRYRC